MTKETVQRFNLQTMSGIFPGTRTPIFQRVRVQPQEAQPAGQAAGTPAISQWVQLAWYTDPDACVAYALQPGTAIDYALPLVRIEEPLAANFNQRLQAALAAHQQQLRSCGSCHFWQQGAVVTLEGLPVGHCRLDVRSPQQWQDGTAQFAAAASGKTDILGTLALQSALALDCPHWQPSDDGISAVEPTGATRHALAPMRKVAESAEIRLSLWQRFKKRLLVRLGRSQPRNWETLFLERSGVGAGTEPCFVCQGRIANLGALTVSTPEGDKQTFSVWRCRHCYTVYLNNWIDRWERLENLETEESYYRLAPAEAKELLTVIYSVVGGEHPNRRQEREAERAYILTFMAARLPLSHQIRQGR